MNENFETNSVNPNSQPVGEPVSEPVSEPVENLQENLYDAQAPIVNEVPVVNNVMEEPLVYPTNTNLGETTINKKTKPNKINAILGVLAVIIVGLIGFFIYFVVSSNNPVNFYRGIIKKSINDTFEVAFNTENKISTSLDLAVKLDLEDGILDKKIVDLINDLKLEFTGEIDREKEQAVLKFDSNYDKEKLLNLELYVDSNKEKTYLYAKDYIDKYLEVPVDDYSEISKVFETNAIFKNDKSVDKGKEIIIKEFTKIITEDDCYKEDDYLVFEITQEKLYEKLEKVFKNLKDNKKFINYFTNEDEIIDILDGLISGFDSEYASDEKMKILVSKDGFFNKLEEVIVKFEDAKLEFEFDDENVEFEMESYDEKVLSGNYILEKNKNGYELELSVKVPEFGKVKVSLNNEIAYGKNVSSIDKSNVKKIEELSEKEQTDIMNKLQESKLFEIVGSFMPTFEDEGSIELDTNLDNGNVGNYVGNEIELYSGRKVSFNVPLGYELSYSGKTFRTYENGDIEVNIEAEYDETVDDYLDDLDDDLSFYKDIYQNISLSPKQNKVINGKTFFYRTLSYDYVGYSTTHYTETYIILPINSEDSVLIEVSATDGDITESDLQTFLTMSY